MTLEIDFETRSDIDIKTRGVYNYMASSHTRPLFCSYKLNGASVKRWDASEPCPPEIINHVAAGGVIKAHNAGFERLLWQKILTPRYGWPVARLEQFVCTAATAAALSLPRDLRGLGEALDLKIKKDNEGSRLIRKFSLPRKPKKGEPDGLYFTQPHEAPEDWEKFKAYCDIDVEAEAEADARMVPLSQADLERYWRSERINDRGIRIDIPSVLAAIELAEKAKAELDREITFITGGYVTATSQVAKLTAWVESQGVTLATLGKADIEEVLHLEDIPTHVRRALELRQEGGKSSVSKLTSFLNRVGPDGRIRGAFLFRAAGTGRYSSLGAQLHNLPRPRKEFGDAHLCLSTLFTAIRTQSPAYIKLFYGETLGRVMWLLSDAIRGFIWAAPGHELLAADYSGIEGAVAAWFAGEEWKVRAMFELIDDPSLPDLYRRAAAGIFNCPVEQLGKKDGRRQVGKVSELSLQYQGGVGAFRSMARGYNLRIDDVYDPVWAAASDERREAAEKRYEECLERNDVNGLTRREWIAAELVKVGWRNTHPAICESWYLLENAVWEAVHNPGTIVSVLKVKYLVRGGFLWCLLPSGRCLAYGAPKVAEVEVPWADKAQPVEKREKKKAVTVLGSIRAGERTVFMRYALYGGILFENCLGADTKVLTPYGCKRIVDITDSDLLWDGVEWVSHSGVTFQGVQNTGDFAGVRMTPDHKIWTRYGWKEAKHTEIIDAKAASSGCGFNRPDLWPFDCSGLRRQYRFKEPVACGVPVRCSENLCCIRAEERSNEKLRMLSDRKNESGKEAWALRTRSILHLASYDRPLWITITQSLQKLRRSWDKCLRSLAGFYEFLRGSKRYLCERFATRPNRQQRGVLTRELSLGNSGCTMSQQTNEPYDSHTKRPDVGLRSRRDIRDCCNYTTLPCVSRLASESDVRQTGFHQSDILEPVYDILNAGPRRRFAVQTADGDFIIVSNCVQAIALDLLDNGLELAEEAGYDVVAHVHDEIVCEVPKGFGDLDEFCKLICQLPAWAEGLPLTASGWRGKRYRKD